MGKKLNDLDDIEDNIQLTPIFCIAPISNTTLDRLVDELQEYYETEAGNIAARNIYIVTKDDTTILQDDPRRTQTPVAAFDSPFIGWTLKQLRVRWRQIFRDACPEGSAFTARTFIVLDERTEEDRTCIVVSESVDKGEARAAFAVATDVLCSPEVGTCELNEGLYPDEARDERNDETTAGGGILYARDYYKKKRR